MVSTEVKCVRRVIGGGGATRQFARRLAEAAQFATRKQIANVSRQLTEGRSTESRGQQDP